MNRPESREMPEGIVDQQGACIYCGQLHMIHASQVMDDERLNHEATMICDCYDAGIYKNKVRRKKRAVEALERILVCAGMDEILDSTKDVCRAVLEEVLEYRVNSATVVTEGGVKIIIKNGKEKVMIKRERKLVSAEEV